jgi:hypothetical protein
MLEYFPEGRDSEADRDSWQWICFHELERRRLYGFDQLHGHYEIRYFGDCDFYFHSAS